MSVAAEKLSPTKEKLILTAIELYAQSGIDAVSLRTISAESGTRNSAAAHYHFHDRKGLIDAVLHYISAMMQENAVASTAMLKEATVTARPVGEILKATYGGLFNLRVAYPWGRAACKVLSRLLIETDADIRESISRYFRANLELAREALALALPGMPRSELTLRMMLMADSAVHIAAEFETLSLAPLNDYGDLDEQQMLEHYFAFLEGGLTRPLNGR